MKLIISIFLIFNFLNAELVLVANKHSQISTLKKEEVIYLYLGKTNKIDDIDVKPLLLKDEKIHNEFIKNILNKTPGQFNSYWARMIFTGKKSSFPSIDKSNLEIKLQDLNTVVYIHEKDMSDNWKIVYKN